MPTLQRAAVAQLPAHVRRPAYDFARVRAGIVHLGLGAFHRAHQAVYTDDAMQLRGGSWGIVGASLRHSITPDALCVQDQLYTVEILADSAEYRVIGALCASVTAGAQPQVLLEALSSPHTHIVTLTVTEKGYCLGVNGELDIAHPDIEFDLAHPARPKSAIGWLAAGLVARFATHQAPLTVISCDNLNSNGTRLREATSSFLDHAHPAALAWLRQNVSFPQTVVDCIVPAATDASRQRVARSLGLNDAACVQREPYSQWVIEDRFAGPRPAWEQAGAQFVADTRDYERLKLHVLNTCHSALAYLGLQRGYTFVREAIADPELAQFLEELVGREIAPALGPLPTMAYWDRVRARFQNRHIDHRLAQIAQDGAQKLAQRVFPLMSANARSSAPIGHLASIVRSWLRFTEMPIEAAFDNPDVFPAQIRSSSTAREAIAAAREL